MEWIILISEEYEIWFKNLPQKHKLAISTDLEVLRNTGPTLGRPYVDQIFVFLILLNFCILILLSGQHMAVQALAPYCATLPSQLKLQISFSFLGQISCTVT